MHLITDLHQVEDLALRLTLRYLGDAARVKAVVDDSPFNQAGWKVGVYRTDAATPAGYLFFPNHIGRRVGPVHYQRS